MSLPSEGARPSAISDVLLKPWEQLQPHQRPPLYPKQWTRPRPRPSWKVDPAKQTGYELSTPYSRVNRVGTNNAETSFTSSSGLRHRNISKFIL